MHNLNEDLLQFIWQYRLFGTGPYTTVSGKTLEIVTPGEMNFNSGPDFFNGQVRIEGMNLAGNIEIHILSSDWLKHDHQNDRSYDHIILHVVYEHDLDIEQNINNQVEVLELKPLLNPGLLETYKDLCESPADLPCSRQLPAVDDFKFVHWLDRMTVERLEQKVEKVNELFKLFSFDYTQTFYTLLVRNLGFHTNSLPFELLAKHLPVHTLLRHADDPTQLDALLFGTAGLLAEQYADSYMKGLQNEFEFLSRKYGIVPLKPGIFKFSKMRPANFPSQRLAQLSMLLHQHPGLFIAPHHYYDYGLILKVFTTGLRPYWQTHYVPDGRERGNVHSTGRQSAENVMINTFAPFFFFYAVRLNKPEFKEHALQLLQKCKSENNKKSRLFAKKHRLLNNAGCSQGLIHLYDHYCSKKRCLSCGLASEMLKTVKEPEPVYQAAF